MKTSTLLINKKKYKGKFDTVLTKGGLQLAEKTMFAGIPIITCMSNSAELLKFKLDNNWK